MGTVEIPPTMMNGTLRSFHTMKQIILVKTCENPRHVALCHLYELICKCVTISCIFRPGAKRSNRGFLISNDLLDFLGVGKTNLQSLIDQGSTV